MSEPSSANDGYTPDKIFFIHIIFNFLVEEQLHEGNISYNARNSLQNDFNDTKSHCRRSTLRVHLSNQLVSTGKEKSMLRKIETKVSFEIRLNDERWPILIVQTPCSLLLGMLINY